MSEKRTPPEITPGPGQGHKTRLDHYGEQKEERQEGVNWLKLARDAYQFSTSFVDSNYRKSWEDSIRMFNNQFPLASKYNHPAFQKRSRLFRPKIRATIRKNEAAAASAFFSNVDVIDVAPENEDDIRQVFSAELNKYLLQYRLTKSIPWYAIVLGGLQDAQTQGWVAARVEWKYETERVMIQPEGEEGYESDRVISDKPEVTLIPIENLRIDPAASWLAPVETSPYLIELIPMYVCDVKARTRAEEGKGPKWNPVTEDQIRAATGEFDTTRMARNDNKEDATTQNRPVSEYDVVWVQRHIHRHENHDYTFYTLGTQTMLSEPVPLEEVCFHGRRPYVIGTSMLETHRLIPDSVPMLGKDLQEEANEIVNQRLDNVKFVLNKRFYVRRGRNVDVMSLVRNVPAGVTMCDDPDTDIKESNWPDVTGSAYLEQDRVNADFDDLLGNFSSGSVSTARNMNETVGGMKMLKSDASVMTEYVLRTYVETFVEPVLRHILLLEQYYETDQTVMNLAGQKAQMRQKFGVDRVTDEMLLGEMNVTVNVGMGSTDPVAKLNKFIQAMLAFLNVAKAQVPGMNLKMIAREIFSRAGFRDGTRFFEKDPNIAQLEMQLQQAQQLMQQMQQKIQEKESKLQADLMKQADSSETQLKKQQMAEEGQDGRTMMTMAAQMQMDANGTDRTSN